MNSFSRIPRDSFEQNRKTASKPNPKSKEATKGEMWRLGCEPLTETLQLNSGLINTVFLFKYLKIDRLFF